MLQCVECGAHATVDDPSRKEWRKAFHAPSNPYPWNDASRANMHPEKETSSDYWALQLAERN